MRGRRVLILPHLRVAGLPPASQTPPPLTIGVSTELGSALPRQSPVAPGIPLAPTKAFRVSVPKKGRTCARELGVNYLPARSRVKGLKVSISPRADACWPKSGCLAIGFGAVARLSLSVRNPYRRLPRAALVRGLSPSPNAAAKASGCGDPAVEGVV
jgi:hypothetical protein